MTATEIRRAGESAYAHADQTELEIAALETQVLGLNELLRRLRKEQTNWRAGGDGERQVVRVLVDMDDAGWHLLADRAWPGTARANIDVLLVGPGGVFVIDVKNWAQPSVTDGRLWRGDEPQDDTVEKLLAQTTAVEAILAEEGLPPTEVVPLFALANRRNFTARLGRVVVCGERDLPRDLTRRGVRLDATQVQRLVATLDRACPPRLRTTESTRRQVRLTVKPEAQLELLSEKEIQLALQRAACAGPIESWMTWLHPRQAQLVAQRWNGPARIRGAAGTGKTVVALHRAKHLAAAGKRVLFTSFVRTLPAVHEQLFARLAPDVPGDVEFVNIHAWAMRLLASRGVRPQPGDADSCFNLAWLHVGRGSALAHLGSRQYWQEEVRDVIKSRALESSEDYAVLRRIGRRLPLQPSHRAAVWELYQEYERIRADRGVHDWADVLTLALGSVTADPVEPGFDAVIIDEVQDLSCVGARLLHALVGDAPDGLLLVGDGQQAVYPGGFSLTEAGISVVGRARVLERNYRNGSEILRAALAVVGADEYDDLDTDPVTAARQVDLDRHGGTVVRCVATDRAAQEQSLLEQLRSCTAAGIRSGDMALLCPTRAEADRWLDAITRAGYAAVPLVSYDGRAIDAVKVGTYQRAKGLEFAAVFIPDHLQVPSPRHIGEDEGAHAERASLERRQLFVAMTRARDLLWLGCSSASSENLRAEVATVPPRGMSRREQCLTD